MATAAAANGAMEAKAHPPHRLWTLAEARAVFELGAFYAVRPLLASLPKGDGHTVLTLPGFLATNNSTVPMRGLLRSLGYDAHGWDSGRNLRIDSGLLQRLESQIAGLNDASGGKISLVGWSLGGTIARELAKLFPDRVRLVISLGSPISDNRDHTNASRLFEYFNRDVPEAQHGGRFNDLGKAPPVPTTSILTRTDGIVHWRGSLQRPGSTPSENIEVRASHCGLGVNPSVMIAIADRLAQPEGQWTPFQPQPEHRWMFPQRPLN